MKNMLATTFAAIIMFAATTGSAAQADPLPTQQAEELLEEVARTYREATTLSDTVTITLGADVMTMEFRFDEKGNVLAQMPGGSITVLNGTLYLEDDMVQAKYLAVPMKGDLEAMLAEVYGPGAMLPYHFTMRDGKGTAANVDALTFGFLPQPRLDSVNDIELEDGKQRHEILILGEGGKATVNIHPRAKFVTSIHLELDSPMSPASDEKITVTLSAEPMITDTLESPITFEPGDRTAVTDARELMPEPPRVVQDGEPAPAFSLETLDGETLTFSDMEGKVLVLDFWATWCTPCIRALPMLDSFAAWVKDNGHPVEVYAVNVWEHRAQNAEQRKEIAKAFWTGQDFSLLTTLMDYDDSAIGAFGYQSIPTTVIIGPDGKVFKTHVGFSSDMDEMLRHSVLAALRED